METITVQKPDTTGSCQSSGDTRKRPDRMGSCQFSGDTHASESESDESEDRRLSGGSSKNRQADDNEGLLQDNIAEDQLIVSSEDDTEKREVTLCSRPGEYTLTPALKCKPTRSAEAEKRRRKNRKRRRQIRQNGGPLPPHYRYESYKSVLNKASHQVQPDRYGLYKRSYTFVTHLPPKRRDEDN